MTNRTGGRGEHLPRPVPVVPVAKPRGYAAKPSSTNQQQQQQQKQQQHYENQIPVKHPAGPVKSKSKSGSSGAVPKRDSPGDSDTMTKTKAILNEAADAVAKSFAKQTQGINKGRAWKQNNKIIWVFLQD
jgi:hypothetical protein